MKNTLEGPRRKNKKESTKPHIENPTLRGDFGNLLEKSKNIEHQLDLNLINTRLWLDGLCKKYGREITIDNVPEEEWKDLFDKYDMFWFMGIYSPSEASRNHAKIYVDQYRYALPKIKEEEVVASPFAIPAYEPNPKIAKDWEAWDIMKDKLHENGKKIILDFVPNHTALDHPWTKEHPEYYIQGTREMYENDKNLFYLVEANDGNTYFLAHGKDPNYPEWADTLQLNYAKREVQEDMKDILLKLQEHSDGVRCDMAMLLDAETFIRTWGWRLSKEEMEYISKNNFWEKTIPEIKAKAKEKGRDFLFIAEAYWDKEELGENFDYIYRKDLYDDFKKVMQGELNPIHLTKHIEFLIERANKGRHYRDVLFTENHDEERARSIFGEKASEAAAVLVGLIPDSIFMVNQGQPEGKTIRPPMQIGTIPKEETNLEIQTQYEKLLSIKHSRLFEEGKWSTFESGTLPSQIQALRVEAPEGNDDYEKGAIILVNFSPEVAGGTIPPINKNHDIEVQSLSNGVIENPDGKREEGVFVKLEPWETQIIFYSKKE